MFESQKLEIFRFSWRVLIEVSIASKMYLKMQLFEIIYHFRTLIRNFQLHFSNMALDFQIRNFWISRFFRIHSPTVGIQLQARQRNRNVFNVCINVIIVYYITYKMYYVITLQLILILFNLWGWKDGVVHQKTTFKKISL